MDLNTIHSGVHKRKRKKRVGRGVASGHGKTATRGSKGQYGSAGAEMFSPLFEGGQTPLFRRIPKRGFSHETWRKRYIIVNVGDLDQIFDNGENVDFAALRATGLAKGPADGVRILGEGDLTKKLTVKANHFSKSAIQKIQAKGGVAEVIAPPKKPVKNKMKPRPSTEG